MTLSIADVEHVAKLARLSLTEEEKQQYATQLSAIFDYMAILDDVNTDGVLETCQVTGLANVFRDDEVAQQTEEERQAIIAAFPEKVGPLLKVKAVFE